jgi:hypothetical protein
VWARTALFTPAADLPRDFTDLLSLDAVDEIVSTRGLRTPFVRMAQDGAVLDPSRYTAPGGAGAEIADQVDPDKVLALVADGATLVLQGMHRFWPPLVAHATALAAELGAPVQVNAYITPAQSRGFSAHYDVHDVFVLQVTGRKRWLVHEPVLPAPLRTQPWTDARAAVGAAAAGPPVLSQALEPGDSLYLPRGWVHAADALGETSVHVTVGVHPVTRYDVVEALTALVARDPALRASLPLGVDIADPVALGADLDATRAALVAALGRVDPGDVAGELRRRVWPRARPAPVHPFAQAAAAAGAGASTCVRRRDALRVDLRHRGDRVVLVLTDREVGLPVVAGPAVEALLAGPPVRVDALPGLDVADAIVVVRRLLREAVVVPVPADRWSGGGS